MRPVSHDLRFEMLRNRLFAEYLGTATIVATVVGSGIMATNLSTDVGIQLLINTVATVFTLYIAITLLGPISGAHFNPLVSLIAAYKKDLKISESLGYIGSQFAGGLIGVALANLMFELPALTASTHIRSGGHLYLSEVIATAGLIFIIFAALDQKREKKIPNLVACWIGAAYFFTSSTSFANPAITIGRVFSDTFAGIAPSSVLPFIVAQLVGATIGLFVVKSIAKVK